MEKYYTCDEVAERYKVKVRTVWDWIRSGKLQAAKMAGAKLYRITEDDLKQFEEDGRKRSYHS